MSKYSNDSIKEYANNNLLKNANFAYIYSNIHIDVEEILNSDKIMTDNNIYKKNFGINIKTLF